MPNSYQKTRYSRAAIHDFVARQHDLINETLLTGQAMQTVQSFQHAQQQPDGPVDLLYLFVDSEQALPVLGFQQLDAEQDDQELYGLANIDSRLTSAWQKEVEH
jgi:hypothetical protein